MTLNTECTALLTTLQLVDQTMKSVPTELIEAVVASFGADPKWVDLTRSGIRAMNLTIQFVIEVRSRESPVYNRHVRAPPPAACTLPNGRA